jgi:hypothetical protein
MVKVQRVGAFPPSCFQYALNQACKSEGAAMALGSGGSEEPRIQQATSLGEELAKDWSSMPSRGARLTSSRGNSP